MSVIAARQNKRAERCAGKRVTAASDRSVSLAVREVTGKQLKATGYHGATHATEEASFHASRGGESHRPYCPTNWVLGRGKERAAHSQLAAIFSVRERARETLLTCVSRPVKNC